MRVMKKVSIELTDQDILEHAQTAARLDEEIGSLKVELDGHKNRINPMIRSKISERWQALKIINTGLELKTVECDVEEDLKKKVIKYIYKGQVVEERPMTDDDLQVEGDLS